VGPPGPGDVAIFERLTLEAFQSGLSWLTILRKAATPSAPAFDGFDIERVAGYGRRRPHPAVADARIVRNRAKVEATIQPTHARPPRYASPTARVRVDRLVWSFAPSGRRARPRRLVDIVASTPGVDGAREALKRHGFVFVGPTTMHAAMQAMGLVDERT